MLKWKYFFFVCVKLANNNGLNTTVCINVDVDVCLLWSLLWSVLNYLLQKFGMFHTAEDKGFACSGYHHIQYIKDFKLDHELSQPFTSRNVFFFKNNSVRAIKKKSKFQEFFTCRTFLPKSLVFRKMECLSQMTMQ